MNKNTYSYYKKSYRANKSYRDKIGDENYGSMLNKREFNSMLEVGLDVSEIVYNQFHFYTRKTAKFIQKSLKQEGFNRSLKQIQNREYTPDMYKKMKDLYHELIEDMPSSEAANLISYTFWGS